MNENILMLKIMMGFSVPYMLYAAYIAVRVFRQKNAVERQLQAWRKRREQLLAERGQA